MPSSNLFDGGNMDQSPTFNQVDALDIAFQAVRLYAETHPRPFHVTLGQAAEMLGVPMDSLMKLMSAKKLLLNECGSIPIGDIDRVLASRCKRLGREPQKERGRKTNANAEEPMPARSRPRSDSPDGALMRMVEVEEMVGLSAATIYRHIKAGRFPRPLKMGFVSLWVRAEVEMWIQEQVAVRDA